MIGEAVGLLKKQTIFRIQNGFCQTTAVECRNFGKSFFKRSFVIQAF